jgi:hypothetical protein
MGGIFNEKEGEIYLATQFLPNFLKLLASIYN